MKLSIALVGLFLFSAACTSPVSAPPVEKVFSTASIAHQAPEPSLGLDFNFDGTLSMQGFVRPKDGRFSQLLQDLDLSFASLWKPDQITYRRFGSIIEPIAQRPFYAAASSESFFKKTKDYATTRIDKVFQTSKPGRLNLVMTDLFEQNLDISSIQQALKAASFPQRSSLAIWQWNMPFDGPIFDFDIRLHQGREYVGNRYVYLLALGANDSIEKLRLAMDRTITVGKPNLLLLSDQPVKAGPGWLAVTQTQNAALKSRSATVAGSVPYSVYRISRGCTTASLTAHPELTPSTVGAPGLVSPGTYADSFYALSAGKGSWSPRPLTEPELRSTSDRSGRELVRVDVRCADVAASQLTLLRISRPGSGNDLILPPWVAASSSNSMEFNNILAQKQPGWGQKTLNLLPFIKGLASTAIEQSTLAIAYIYLVAN